MERDRQLRAPFRFAAQLGRLASNFVNNFVDSAQNAPQKLTESPYVKQALSTAESIQRRARQIVSTRPFVPALLLAVIVVLLPPACVCISVVAFFTAPLWISLAFATSILWVPAVIASFILLQLLLLFLTAVGVVRVLSSPKVKAAVTPWIRYLSESRIAGFLIFESPE